MATTLRAGRRVGSLLIALALAIAMTIAVAAPAQAVSGYLYCGQGGYPDTYGVGTGWIRHYVARSGPYWVYGTAGVTHPFATGTQYWSITGSVSSGSGACWA